MFGRGEPEQIERKDFYMATARFASANRTSYRRSYGMNTHKEYGQGQMYIYGNTVRQEDVIPQKVSRVRSRRKKETSRLVRRNRNRAFNISSAYACFLAVAAVAAVLLCVSYLQLQSELVNRSENITALQGELVELTEANNTAYQVAEDSVDLEEVRNKAVNELGMVYAAQGSVTEYTRPESNYVKQYSEIPQSGVLAKSVDVSQE